MKFPLFRSRQPEEFVDRSKHHDEYVEMISRFNTKGDPYPHQRAWRITSRKINPIVNKISKFITEGEPLTFLLVSLYALHTNASEDIKFFLRKYIIDLTKCLSKYEIGTLLTNCIYLSEKFTRRWKSSGYITPSFFVHLGLQMCHNKSITEPNILFANIHSKEYDNTFNYSDYYAEDNDLLEAWSFQHILYYFNTYYEGSNSTRKKNYQIARTLVNLQKKYDYIIAHPQINHNEEIIGGELISLAKNYLKDNGQICCLLPYESTYNHKWEGFRKMAYDLGFDMKVITISNQLCNDYDRKVQERLYKQHLQIIRSSDKWDYLSNFCIICLKKTCTGNITLIDGDTAEGRDFLFNSIKGDFFTSIEKDNGKYVWHGNMSDIIENYNFRPIVYLMEQRLPVPQKNESRIEMGNLVEIVPFDNFGVGSNKHPEINLNYLTNDYLNCYIKYQRIFHQSKDASRLLSSDALLFASNQKISKFCYEGESVRLDHGIIPFKLKSQDIILEEYLLFALTTEDILKQVKMYKFNDELSINDFLRLKPLVPSIERQHQMITDAKTIRKILNETLEEKERRYKQMKWLNEAHIRNTKHTLSGHILPMRMGVNRLVNFFSNNPDGVKLSSIIGEKTGQTVDDLLKGLRDSIEKISLDIENFTKSEDVGKEERVINIAEEIDSYCKTLLGEYGNIFKIKKVGLDEEIYIKISLKSLICMLDNIVGNAVRHGFVEGKDDYIISFSIEVTNEQMCRISIANNGKPISERAIKTYFERGSIAEETGHTGEGGFSIYEICDNAGGRALIPENKDGYVVISVEFPLA